ncbi:MULTISPECIES: hypothetical protein [Microbacterium]|uniref:hypothetical protein n=1 Tax=Microbacterium TaxID=33882 RepID=UPI000F5EBBA2|nr:MULTISPECIES: hypothetical protein [Microbacterium]AZH79148.1 hypothetical protein CSX12_12175 [Microbacterium sp. Y-01]MBM7464990.1 hypothetical protein [Microbacterium esteraromaticum]
MIAADQSIKAILGDGTIEAEAARRLKVKVAGVGTRDSWSPVTDARVRMAVTRVLSAIHDELVARPGIVWEESVALDALLGQYWLNVVIDYVFDGRAER